MLEMIRDLVLAAVFLSKLLLLLLQRKGFFLPLLLYPEPWNTGTLCVSVTMTLEPKPAHSDHWYLLVQMTSIALLLIQMDFSLYLQCFVHLQIPPTAPVISIITLMVLFGALHSLSIGQFFRARIMYCLAYSTSYWAQNKWWLCLKRDIIKFRPSKF